MVCAKVTNLMEQTEIASETGNERTVLTTSVGTGTESVGLHPFLTVVNYHRRDAPTS